MGKTETEFRCYPCSEPPYQETKSPRKKIREVPIGGRIEEIRKLVRRVGSFDTSIDSKTPKTVGATVYVEVRMLLTHEKQGGLIEMLNQLQGKEALFIKKQEEENGIRYRIYLPRTNPEAFRSFRACLKSYLS
jgi:hypothetical protein